MKKLILFVEQDYIDILQEFKRDVLKDENQTDEKAIILMTRFFMEQRKKVQSLF